MTVPQNFFFKLLLHAIAFVLSNSLGLARAYAGNNTQKFENDMGEEVFGLSANFTGESRRLLGAAANPRAWKTEYWRTHYTSFSQDPFTSNNRNKLPPLSRVVKNGKLTCYAGAWDERLYGAGTRQYWMGLTNGGCNFGDLRNTPGRPRSQSIYPYMNAAGLTPSLRAALGMKLFVHGIGCGACIKVTCDDKYYCPKGPTSAVVMVTDFCPENGGCAKMQMDVFRATFLLATGDSPSNPKARFQRVACPDPLTTIRVGVGIHRGPQGYLKVVFWNVGAYGVITKVDYACCSRRMGISSGGTYLCAKGKKPVRVTMNRANGAMWDTGNKNTPPQQFCQFILFQEDGTRIATKMTAPLKRGELQYWQDQWVEKRDTRVQFYQSIRDVKGRRFSAQRLAR